MCRLFECGHGFVFVVLRGCYSWYVLVLGYIVDHHESQQKEVMTKAMYSHVEESRKMQRRVVNS